MTSDKRTETLPLIHFLNSTLQRPVKPVGSEPVPPGSGLAAIPDRRLHPDPVHPEGQRTPGKNRSPTLTSGNLHSASVRETAHTSETSLYMLSVG